MNNLFFRKTQNIKLAATQRKKNYLVCQKQTIFKKLNNRNEKKIINE